MEHARSRESTEGKVGGGHSSWRMVACAAWTNRQKAGCHTVPFGAVSPRTRGTPQSPAETRQHAEEPAAPNPREKPAPPPKARKPAPRHKPGRPGSPHEPGRPAPVHEARTARLTSRSPGPARPLARWRG